MGSLEYKEVLIWYWWEWISFCVWWGMLFHSYGHNKAIEEPTMQPEMDMDSMQRVLSDKSRCGLFWVQGGSGLTVMRWDLIFCTIGYVFHTYTYNSPMEESTIYWELDIGSMQQLMDNKSHGGAIWVQLTVMRIDLFFLHFMICVLHEYIETCPFNGWKYWKQCFGDKPTNIMLVEPSVWPTWARKITVWIYACGVPKISK